MNKSQEKVQQYMESQIDGMEHGLSCLKDRDYQPNELGDLYNGMLKHTVSFEIQHMERLRDELMDLLA